MSTIVGSDITNGASMGALGNNLAELELGLLRRDGVENKATLGIVQHSVSVVGLFNFQDILEADGELLIRSDLSVNLHKSLHCDHLNFSSVHSILESVAEEEEHGDALAKLVTSGSRERGLRDKSE